MTLPLVKHVLLAVATYALASTAVFAAGLAVTFGPARFGGIDQHSTVARTSAIGPGAAKAQYAADDFGP